MSNLTQTDLQAIIDLTIETNKELFPIRPTLYYKDIQRNGRANWKSNSITVPQWAGKIGESYLIYYTLHELTHYVNGHLGGHGAMFKQMEDKLLKQWDLSIVRAKAYPKALFKSGKPEPTL